MTCKYILVKVLESPNIYKNDIFLSSKPNNVLLELREDRLYHPFYLDKKYNQILPPIMLDLLSQANIEVLNLTDEQASDIITRENAIRELEG